VTNKRIGIIGGVGPSATVLYYQQIIEGFRGRVENTHFPEILIHSLDLMEINNHFYNKDMDSLSDKIEKAVRGLEKAGCAFALLSCNAMHMVFDRVQMRVQVPMVSIIEAVLNEVKQRQLKRIGIMGTTFVMQSTLYRQPLEQSGVQCLLPNEKEQSWIMEAINDDLQLPKIPEETVTRLLMNVENLGAQGAEEILLACTDLPVAISEEKSSIPILDSTSIHVRAILDFAFGSVK